ncbi:MAG: hydroxyisourate hydrolase [Alphaproteobacteria bacterium]
MYKLRFYTAPYFKSQNLKSVYPYIEIVFEMTGNGHYHIPLTVSANGYSTYKGN